MTNLKLSANVCAMHVMDVQGYTEIPQQLILKRWTRDARDMLLPHLQIYQRDHAGSRTMTHRHTMELVRLGDSCVEAYEKGMKLISEGIAVLSEFEDQRDGLALEDRPSSAAHKGNEKIPDEGDGGQQVQEDTLAGLGTPEKKREAGQPTNSRETAPYEALSTRTRFCSICRGKGHKKTTCPGRGDLLKKPRKEAKCSNCGVARHRKNTCTNPDTVKLQTAP